MPESSARVEELPFLNPNEKCIPNRIRGRAYLCIFGLVEEFILPFVLDGRAVGARWEDNPTSIRARIRSRVMSRIKGMLTCSWNSSTKMSFPGYGGLRRQVNPFSSKRVSGIIWLNRERRLATGCMLWHTPPRCRRKAFRQNLPALL